MGFRNSNQRSEIATFFFVWPVGRLASRSLSLGLMISCISNTKPSQVIIKSLCHSPVTVLVYVCFSKIHIAVLECFTTTWYILCHKYPPWVLFHPQQAWVKATWFTAASMVSLVSALLLDPYPYKLAPLRVVPLGKPLKLCTFSQMVQSRTPSESRSHQPPKEPFSYNFSQSKPPRLLTVTVCSWSLALLPLHHLPAVLLSQFRWPRVPVKHKKDLE